MTLRKKLNNRNKIIELNYKYLFKAIAILVISSMAIGISSCKSHKKSKKDDFIYIGETVEIKKSEKKESKENKIGEKIAEEALTWIGTPYAYARQDKGVATDCSGLVFVLYQEIADIKMPRNSALQADFCKTINEKNIKPGDLVFFATGSDKKKISHVGVMIDKGKFVHASGSKGVIISEMTTPYYQRCFIKYGRVPGVNN